MHRTSRASSVVLALGFALACAARPAPPAPVEDAPLAPAPFELVFQPADADVARELEPVLRAAVADVERWFGAPFAARFTITLHPDRASFDTTLPPEWGIERTECWMVASGIATGVQALSPRVWKTEACEHDPADARHVADLFAHELVHVYHGQRNPSPDFVDTTGIDWFVEGLATLASGQLAHEHAGGARAALEAGNGPRELATAWSGKGRYAVCGSLVAFVERELGRARVIEMLGATSGDELLALAGMEEPELLERWRASVARE